MKSAVLPVLFIMFLGGISIPLFGQNPCTINLDISHPGISIPENFLGLSYETGLVNPDTKGNYYFNPQNAPLIKMFQTLGIKSLRIGGNTVDNAKINVPQKADIDKLFGFAQAANVKVIYSFRLKNGNVAESQKLAKYVNEHYAANLECFAIGNEPNVYAKPFATYAAQWKPYFQAVG